MRVLFISRAKTNDAVSCIVENQGESLKEKGIELTYFIIKGVGVRGYLKSIVELKGYLKYNKYDIVHSHYSLSGFTAAIARANPLIVSLMGSDVKSKLYYRFIIKLFETFYWSKTIVKSDDMRTSLKSRKAIVVPNGVNFNIFKPIEKELALKHTNWNPSKKNILFAANPERIEKNFKLAKEAFDLLDRNDVELHYLDNVPNNQMPYYYNASDVILLTSLWEGSPNVIKEAMACNVPIVATNVGDIKQVIKNTKGCFLSTFNVEDVSNKLNKALSHNAVTNGREHIQHLSSQRIADKVISIYKSVI